MKLPKPTVPPSFDGAIDYSRVLFSLDNDLRFIYPLPDDEGKFAAFLEVNDASCRFLGYRREELLKLSPADILKKGYFSRKRNFVATLKDKGHSIFESVLVGKSGEEIPVEISARLFYLQGNAMVSSAVRDISLRKKQEAELKERNEFLNTILDSLKHPFYVINAETYRIELANDAAGKTGGATCYERSHGRSQPCGGDTHSCPLEIVKKTKKSTVTEHVHYNKDGEPVVVEVHGHPILDEQGKVTRLIEYGIDITERQKSSEALKDSESKFRAITGTATDAIILIDNKGLVSYWNPAAENIFGYTAEEIAGKYLHDFIVPKKYLERFRENFPVFQKTGKGPAIGKILELKALKRDGSEFPAELSLSAVKLEGQWHSTGIVRDISQRKAAESENRKLADVVKQAYDSIVITDKRGNIEYVNPAFERLSGYTFEEVKGKNPRILRTPGKNKETNASDVWKTISSGNTWRGEFLNRKRNGEDFLVNAAIFPIKDPVTGQINGYGAVRTDITARRRLEERLQESVEKMRVLKEEAESANLLKSSFLANVSHDIRTPLNSILGFADLMLKRESNEKSKEYLQIMKNSGTALLSLLNDILDFSKIEAGQLDIFNHTFSVMELLEDIESVFEIRAEQKKLRFVIRRESGIPQTACSDHLRIQQVLNNVLSNAFKFTDHGSVTLAISFDKPADILIFTIKDSGVGIPVGDLEHIFSPFAQARSKASGALAKGGTGLGLAICSNLLKLLGGTIAVQSRVNEGTEFTIQIPANSGEVERLLEKNTAHVSISADLKSSIILVVDDNPVNREVIKEQLNNDGFQAILCAVDGSDALAQVAQVAPDLILMDIQMPEMDGNKAIAELRRVGFDKPIIALSAYAMQADIEKSLKLGADDYITKPIDFDHFFRQLHKFLAVSASTHAPQTDTDGLKNYEAQTFDENTSANIRKVFLDDLRQKVEILKHVLENDDMENDRAKVKVIAHTYKGNAGYLGLSQLEEAARDLEVEIMNGKPDQNKVRHMLHFAELLKRIIEKNS
ncbi:MAG: PAS domain S-box protein, partial [bacterium]|nr:PAS domain S-box protein [bacterium]